MRSLALACSLLVALPPGWCCIRPSGCCNRASAQAGKSIPEPCAGCCAGKHAPIDSPQPEPAKAPARCCCEHNYTPPPAPDDTDADLAVFAGLPAALADLADDQVVGDDSLILHVHSPPLRLLLCVWRC